MSELEKIISDKPSYCKYPNTPIRICDSVSDRDCNGYTGCHSVICAELSKVKADAVRIVNDAKIDSMHSSNESYEDDFERGFDTAVEDANKQLDQAIEKIKGL